MQASERRHKMNRRILFYVAAVMILPALIYAAATDYLILQDIGPYKLFTTIFPEDFKGPLPKYSQTTTGGILTAAGHFSEGDVSYAASYTEPSSKWPFIDVEVTKHSGADSDKWLLHEMEDTYRSDDPSQLGLLSQGTIIKKLGNDRFFSIRLGGGSYMWVNNNIVIKITYRSIQGGKPEPIEVIQAYLQKFPSTIPVTLVLDKAHDVQWIKDEMERRLWLCDKWFYQLQLGKVQQNQVYQESVKSMNVFLDYREKYYGIKAADEKNLLASYLSTNNGTSIKAKLTEYKNWWSLNKNKAISL
jgi:hypothetical protein